MLLSVGKMMDILAEDLPVIQAVVNVMFRNDVLFFFVCVCIYCDFVVIDE